MNSAAHEGNRVKHPFTKEVGLVVRVYRVGNVDWASVRFEKGLQTWPAGRIEVV